MTGETTPICNNTSVGIIVKRFNDLLLIERQKYPYGFACPAGHVEPHEAYASAANRELREETGLTGRTTTSFTPVAHGKRFNRCRRERGDFHYWIVYQTELKDDALYHNTDDLLSHTEDESKRIGFYTPEQVRHLATRTELYQAQLISDDEWRMSP